MPEHETEAAQAELAAALLAIGRQLDRASLALTVGGLLALVIAPLASPPRLGLLVAVFAGVFEFSFACRTAFDERIFSTWARRWRQTDTAPEETLAAFDRALASSGLRKTPAAPNRPLADRIAGARRLLRKQGACLMLQVLAWLVACGLVIRPF